ncbi:type VI secretion system tip protein TssI/VgrG [Polyangium sp. y55x31]|uniref:type VI secretion system Vgr family protein n=1 Tax=Polyangium sp. y55x31 TaxID=3042688 RepID=UPI002482645D|nr:type VI secretion system tip protein TssI/VgrG [Polyangium sp. y55x31]MDI1480897.1 type VI secretion system tip protein TssI/VgrG [Polyangium sp. y55x31]
MTTQDVAFACEPLGENVVLSLHGREIMDDLSSFEMDVAVAGEVDPESLVRAPCVLVLSDPEEGTARAIQLVVTEVAEEVRRGRDRVLSLRLADPLAPLALRAGYRVFQDKTSEEIVTEVLAGAGVPRDAIVARLSGEYPLYPLCTQHGETEWDFVCRLLAREGISFWTETAEDGAWRVLFGDGTASHDGIDGDPRLPFAGPGSTRARGVRALLSLSWEAGLSHDRVFVRDFDVDHPDIYLDGEAGDGALEWLEYPACVPDARAAAARAKRRLEQLRRDEVKVEATSDCMRLRPGRLVEVAGGGVDVFDQRFLVSEVRHEFDRPLPGGGKGSPYHNQVVLRPTLGDRGEERPPHRPAIRKEPRIHHVESAVVTGPPGEEVHTDPLGRVKIRFLWDRSGITDDRSSSWIRTMQWPLGGAMMIPRVGFEVAVSFLDGLADRPFVLGRLYNATAVHPYVLPSARAVTALQSWTSPGDGTTQEIRFGDDAGAEAFFVHASRDLGVRVGGDFTQTTDGDEAHVVGLGLAAHVGGAEDVTIGGNQRVDVGKPIHIAVDGANAESMATEIVAVTGNRVVLCGGGYEESVGGAYVLQCNQSNTKTTGTFTRIVGGSKLVSAGLSVTESVAGARTYVCRGARVVTCAGAYSESVQGGKRSAAGAVTESAAADHGIAAPTGKLASGQVELRAGGTFSIAAPQITIDVSGSLTAGALEIAGGALRAKSGTTTIEGMVKRDQGGEVGG